MCWEISLSTFYHCWPGVRMHFTQKSFTENVHSFRYRDQAVRAEAGGEGSIIRGVLVLEWYRGDAVLAFNLLFIRCRFTVVDESEDKTPVLHLRGRHLGILHLLARHLEVELSPRPGGPPHGVEDDGQVGEGRRQQRPRVEKLDGEIKPGVPTTIQW